MGRLAQIVTDSNGWYKIGAPFCVIQSVPTESRANELVVFDASQSHGSAGGECKEFTFDFGDGSEPVSSSNAVQTHAMRESGAFEVRVTSVDVNGNKATASLTQRVR